MLGWLIYSKQDAEYNKRYIQMYLEESEKLGLQIRLLFAEEFVFGVKNGKYLLLYQGKVPQKPDFAICRIRYALFTKQLEYMGIRVFNNSKVSEICNDKAKTYQYLAKTKIKMLDTQFYQNEVLEDVLGKMPCHTVIKAVNGHGGKQVFLKENNFEYEKEGDIDQKNFILQGMGTSDFVTQPLTGKRNEDVRVYVLGTEIIAAVKRTAKDGFKSNYSLGGFVENYPLNETEIEIIQKIIKEFQFGLVGIDFLIGEEGEFIFNEIEDVVGARMLYQCNDIPLVSLYLQYIIKQM